MASKLAKNLSICLILVLCACACALDAAAPSVTRKFDEWMSRHGRDYKDVAEKAKRLKIFQENVRLIEEFNRAANRTYKLGLNRYSDLTNEEFVAAYTRCTLPSSTRRNSSQVPSFRDQGLNSIPDSINWVERGAVNPIKDQGPCASCWSFSAVAAVEAITQITSGMLWNLSEQQLIDCDTNNSGCEGGRMDIGFQYIIDNQGISSDSDYPYDGVNGTCNEPATSIAAAKISSYEVVNPSESDLLAAVAMQPVSVALDASGFQSYSSGVYDGPCENSLESLNHAVTVVGYGAEVDGTKYWLIRNSHGDTWGEQGYMKIQRDAGVQGGLCGLALDVSFPVVNLGLITVVNLGLITIVNLVYFTVLF